MVTKSSKNKENKVSSSTSSSSSLGKSKSQPTHPVMVQTIQPPSMLSNIKDGIASGFGWGIGTSVARKIFGLGDSSATSSPTISTTSNSMCQNEQNALNECIRNSEKCHDKDKKEKEESLRKCLRGNDSEM